ncbi:hypothetical protein Btru_070975 [Bulinus truncatus]|nr:hypothetical protein Btru_070975 [Bulinus truncatus]
MQMNVLTISRVVDYQKLFRAHFVRICSRAALYSSLRTVKSPNLQLKELVKATIVQNPTHLSCQRCQVLRYNFISRRYSPIVDEGLATHKPSPFQQKILVWEKFYPSVDKVPERVTHGQMKKAMDKFRIRCSIFMIALTLIASAIMIAIGRSEREQGKSVAKMNLARHEKS